MSQKFSFQELQENNVDKWNLVAINCPYAWDLLATGNHLESCRSSLIIYNQNNDPIAIFKSKQETHSIFGIKFKSLSTFYAGLFIHKNFQSQSQKISQYIQDSLFNDHFKSQMGIDFIFYCPSPTIQVRFPREQLLQPIFNNTIAINNTTLLCELTNDLSSSLSSKARYEVKKGLNNLENYEFIKVVNEEDLALILSLEKQKAQRLNISPLPRYHFEKLLKNERYNFYLVKDNDEPLTVIITNNEKSISTFNYNSSSERAQKEFINKAALFKVMTLEQKNGSSHFLLGDGYDHATKSVTFFKKSMSNTEVFKVMSYTYLTTKGLIYIFLKVFKSFLS